MKRTSLLRRIPLRPMSKKRQKESRIYSKKRADFLDGKMCEICGTRRAVDVHHRLGRLGGAYLDEKTWMALCRTDHDFIHRNPSLAREMGYLG